MKRAKGDLPTSKDLKSLQDRGHSVAPYWSTRLSRCIICGETVRYKYKKRVKSKYCADCWRTELAIRDTYRRLTQTK